ncbi:hypothetical protein AVEN_173644-1, partial [Araneus ventricosus]
MLSLHILRPSLPSNPFSKIRIICRETVLNASSYYGVEISARHELTWILSLPNLRRQLLFHRRTKDAE